jgi:hypothetical protein
MIHDAILERVRAELADALIMSLPSDDSTRAGVVKIGPLQGDPDPDVARISVELYANDPDQELGISAGSSKAETWDDRVEECEVGGGVLWSRRFTVKARCLFETTQEDSDTARKIAMSVRSRIEKSLLGIRFGGLSSENETVIRGVFSENLRSSTTQSGGPPDAYDYFIKVRYEVLTYERVGVFS